MSRPHSFSENVVASPDGCTHLTGADHVASLSAALRSLEGQLDVLDRWGGMLADALCGPTRGRLLAAGNGGSAAQAQHLTAELVGRYRADRPPFSAICLTAETSSLTAIANDYPADELFARQVEAHGRAGDVLVLLSTSGRSPNIVAAARRARELGITTLAITGPAPNPLAAAADEAVCIDSRWTATVQECHLVALHLVCAAFDAAVLAEPPRVPAGTRVEVAGSGQGREHRSEAAADREGASQRGTSEERTDRGGGLGLAARSGAPRGSDPWAR